MNKIEFPDILEIKGKSDNDKLKLKILNLSPSAKKILRIFESAKNWKDAYEVKKINNESTFYVSNLMGLKFNSIENAELYAFLDYLEKCTYYID